MTLRKRVSKNVYDLETVRMVPHPPLKISTAAEARHYAATYALYRVSRVASLLRSVLFSFTHGDDSPTINKTLLVDTYG